MEYLSSKKVGDRLRTIFIKMFTSSEIFKSTILYCRKRLETSEHLTADSILQDTSTQVQVEIFIELAARLYTSKISIENLVFITDPWAVYAFNHFCRESIRMLEEQDEQIFYNVPKEERRFFKKFAGFSLLPE